MNECMAVREQLTEWAVSTLPEDDRREVGARRDADDGPGTNDDGGQHAMDRKAGANDDGGAPRSDANLHGLGRRYLGKRHGGKNQG